MASCTFICIAFALFSVSHGAPKPECRREDDIYYYGDTIETKYPGEDDMKYVGGEEACANWCGSNSECRYWTLYKPSNKCSIKTSDVVRKYDRVSHPVSGTKGCATEASALAVPAVVAPVTGSNFGSCVTNWCRQNGTSDQFTRCESVKDDGLTCVNPEIKYGSTEGGVPKTTGDTKTSAYDLWCQQLGYAKHSRVTIGGRSCYAPRGAVFWWNGLWADQRNGYWKDGTLSWHYGCFEYGIASLTCSK